jgi:hypothetical protein
LRAYWNKLGDWFKYRLIEDLSDLKATLATALDEVTNTGFFTYLCPDRCPEETYEDF